jgi:hypothetical protein
MDHRHDTPQHNKVLLDGPGTVTLPLTNGLPEDAWLWLKRGKQWLDYRSISLQSPWTGDLTRSEVKIETPIDPQASIEALIAAGEGPHIEFKRQLVEYHKLKTVAAFAAGAGGKVVFGIDSDETTVIGLDGGTAQELRDRLGDLVRVAVIPTPEFDVAPFIVNEKTVLVLTVEPGTGSYGVVPHRGGDDKPEYYVRRGANTYPAQPADLNQASARQ